MPVPLDMAGYLFCKVHADVGRRAGFTSTMEEIERSAEKKRALLTKIAELARIPEGRRKSFIRATAGAVGYAWVRCSLPARTKGSDDLFDAYGKVIAARNAVAMLSEQDRALIDEASKDGDIFTLLDIAAEMFSFLLGGDLLPPPKRAAGPPKGGSKDPLFRGFLDHLCRAIRSHEGNVTFTHKTGRPVTGTIVEILILLRPEVKCIPRELKSRAKMIKSVLRQHGLATRVPQNSE
jgi:hypothetical protein